MEIFLSNLLKTKIEQASRMLRIIIFDNAILILPSFLTSIKWNKRVYRNHINLRVSTYNLGLRQKLIVSFKTERKYQTFELMWKIKHLVPSWLSSISRISKIAFRVWHERNSRWLQDVAHHHFHDINAPSRLYLKWNRSCKMICSYLNSFIYILL